jgi:hypothetical protein
VGIGGGPNEWDEYEWVRLADQPDAPVVDLAPLVRALCSWVDETDLWQADGLRILLVDLDNLRADPRRWQARMALVVALARQADHTVLAGQVGAVARGRPHLAEFAKRAKPVADGSDVADYVLLAEADAVLEDGAHVVVLSNDGIFASLAERARLTVLSPGADALSDRLRDAADDVVDLIRLEERALPSHAALRA